MTAESVSKPIDKYIPWMFVAFFLVIAAVDAVFVTMAVRTHSGVVTEQAYERGLEYNKTLEAAAAQDTLGWKSDITLQNGMLRLTLSDKADKPITGAVAKADIKRPVTQGYDTSITFKETGQGLYEAPVNLPLKGQWDVHVYADAHGQNYQTDEELMVP